MDTPANSENQIHWRIKTWFPDLTESTIGLLKQYFVELVRSNKAVNLISAKTIKDADVLHFADCIHACIIVQKKLNVSEVLYDIGSGNGFPGIVYAILFPEQKVCLNEIDDRKAEFLKRVVSTLKLANVSVDTKKIELFGADSISQAICRGFAPLAKTLLTLRKVVKSGGAVYHMKSEEWSAEVSQIPIQLCSSWQPVLIGEYKLPIGDFNLFVVKTDKIN